MFRNELWRLHRANRQLEQSVTLKDEDAKLMGQMFGYMSHKRLNRYDAEAVRADLLGMAQEARQRKQPLRELLGDDYAFCDSLLANCNRSRPLAVLCDLLALLFRLAFMFYAIWFFLPGGYTLFLGQPYALDITARQLFLVLAIYVVLELLLGKVIPQSYSGYRNKQGMSAFAGMSIIIFLQITPLYKQMLLSTVVFSISGYANLAVLALLALIWLGLRYAADMLDYLQSSFGWKTGL